MPDLFANSDDDKPKSLQLLLTLRLLATMQGTLTLSSVHWNDLMNAVLITCCCCVSGLHVQHSCVHYRLIGWLKECQPAEMLCLAGCASQMTHKIWQCSISRHVLARCSHVRMPAASCADVEQYLFCCLTSKWLAGCAIQIIHDVRQCNV